MEYDNIYFEEKDDLIRMVIYTHFYKEFDTEELQEELGSFKISAGKIQTQNAKNQEKLILRLFQKHRKSLIYKLNNNPAIFVDEDLGLPLLGLNFLGIVDKGTEMLEIKPVTNCNADCIFCSVNEGPSSDKEVDFVVDKDFLVKEIFALLQFKKYPMSMWINPHGDPTMYAKLLELCDELLAHEFAKDIHIITNGLLLNKSMVDTFAAIANTHNKPIHISLSMSGLGTAPLPKSKINKKGLPNARLMMGEMYNIKTVLNNLDYAITKLPLTITPVYVHGMNDKELENLVLLAKTLQKKTGTKNLGIAIQKFCKNKRGRNPAKEQSWDEFFDMLKELEKKSGVTLTKPLGKLKATKELPELCTKGDKIEVQIVCKGRYEKDRLGVYRTRGGSRAVTLVGCKAEKGTVKATVIQSKHSMILAKV